MRQITNYHKGTRLTRALIESWVSALCELQSLAITDVEAPLRKMGSTLLALTADDLGGLGFWIGKIKIAGPNAEADYTDERYWVSKCYDANESGDDTDALVVEEFLSTDPSYLCVTATNLGESIAHTHTVVAEDDLVLVFVVPDSLDPSTKRYFFYAKSGGGLPEGGTEYQVLQRSPDSGNPAVWDWVHAYDDTP